jgi:hypothetical protein
VAKEPLPALSKYTGRSLSAVIRLDNPLANLLTINRMRLAVPAKTSYSRLFPAIETPFSYDAMEKLGLFMQGNINRMPDKPGPPRPPPAAYTYFGQFIAHDLTRDDTPLLESPMPEPDEVVNHRTPFMDLDSLYGRGPLSQDSFLYDSDGLHFKLGGATTGTGQAFDVSLDTSGRPLLADSRNNENIIIRQIHAVFLKLHNLAVDELRGRVPDRELFEKARERVRWQYQWLVRQDYLFRICNEETYNDIIKKGNTRIDWGNCFAIPVEFAHAAGRFGHSMVRDSYDLNHGKLKFPVAKIFEEAHQNRPLGSDLAVEWTRFTRDPAMSIDTTIVDALFHLTDKTIRPFVASFTATEPNALPVRTLYRGVGMKIPTGETVRRGLDPSAELCEPCGYDPLKPLRDLDLIGRTPLWYYVLLEAELNEKGRQLGALGSRLVAEVIEGALRSDTGSIINQLERNPSWHPDPWRGNVRIDNFKQLTAVVGLS